MNAAQRTQRRLRRIGKTQRDLARELYYTPSHICNTIHGREGRRNLALMRQINATITRWENEWREQED